jgi:hypothetical protein
MTAVAELAERWEGSSSQRDRDGGACGPGTPRLIGIGPGPGESVRTPGRSRAERGPQSWGPTPFRCSGGKSGTRSLILLAGAAIVSVLVGERVDAGIILAIVCLSVGLGFVNEYRSEKAVEELHSGIRHTAVTTGGSGDRVDVTELYPGTWSARAVDAHGAVPDASSATLMVPPLVEPPKTGRTREDPRHLAFPGSLRPRRQPWSTGRRAS